MITNPHILYVEGSAKELAAIMKLFQHQDTLYGSYDEFKVYEYTCLEEPKAVYVRFKREHQAALLYKGINYYYQEFVRGTKGHLRSYFSKQKFCYRYVQGNKCRKDTCKFMHHEPNKARYLIDGEVVNHVFDHKLAIELLFENSREIRDLYKDKPIEGDHGFLHPLLILDKIGPAGNRKRYYSTSQNENSQEPQPQNGRSTNSVDYEEDEEEEKLEYRPKIQPSENYSSPDHKDKSETLSKNYLSESPDHDNSRKISDFDQVMEPPRSSEDKGYSSEGQYLGNSETNPNSQDKDYEDLIADIDYYVHTEPGYPLWEDTENDQDSQCNFYDDIMKQNLQYLNDMNEISEKDTAHLNQSSSDSMAKETPLGIEEHCRAWALDEIDEDIVVQSGIYSPLKFICSANKELLPFLEGPMPPLAFEIETLTKGRKSSTISPTSKPFKMPLGDLKSLEDKTLDDGSKPKVGKPELVTTMLKEKQISEDFFSRGDNLILIGQKSEYKPKKAVSSEVAAEEEKLNLFVSRAQKKKERDVKKKKNRKIKQEEQKLNANQDLSLPSDSIDVSCIQKKQSKCDHSDEEKEICRMIEDPISQAYLNNENFPMENPLVKAALDDQESIPHECPEEKNDPEEVDKQESQDEEENTDKKGKKKKKKKKKTDTKVSPLGNKNKLSGFQEKLMQEQTIKEDPVSKPTVLKESKISPAEAQPSQKVVEPQVDVEFELAQSLNAVRGASGLDSIFKMMDLMDSSQMNKVVIDSFSSHYACKFLFATCAK